MCVDPYSTEGFEWPTKSMIYQMLASSELHYLTGFESNKQNGTGYWFKWILSNGDRNEQRVAHALTNYTHMMPEGADKMIRSVNIHQNTWFIEGFSFYDKEGHYSTRLEILFSNT